MADAGYQPVLISPESGTVQLFEHLDKADTRAVDLTVAEAKVDDYDGPGAARRGGQPRRPADGRRRGRASSGTSSSPASRWRPSATRRGRWSRPTCVRGRRLTSWPSLQTDVRNAGGDWVDEQVVVDGNLITSRKPDDLPAFNSALLEAVNHGVSSAAAAAS